MNSVYIILVIAGSRTIDSMPPKNIVAVAAGVLEKGIDDGKEYATIEDVPEKYRSAVVAKMIEDGYDIEA